MNHQNKTIKINSLLSRVVPVLGVIAMLVYPLAIFAKPATNFVTGNVGFVDGPDGINASARIAVSGSFGEDGFSHPDIMRHHTFEYRNANGVWYSIDVQIARMDEGTAWFSGPIVDTNDLTLLNKWYLVRVYDSGQLDGNEDTIFIRPISYSLLYPLGSYSLGYNAVRGGYRGGISQEITRGDIQIH